MNYDDALKLLSSMYPNELVSIKYERSIQGSGKESHVSPEITCYTSSTGWSKTQSNFKDAIAAITAWKDLESEISDTSCETRVSENGNNSESEV